MTNLIDANKLLSCLASTFIGVYFIDLEDDSFHEISSTPVFHKALAQVASAQDALDTMVRILMKPEALPEAKQFFDLSTLPRRIGEQEEISIEYEGSLKGWCRGSFIPVTRNQHGEALQVLYAVTEIAREKLVESRQQQVINALSKSFLNIYLVNPSENLARTVKLDGYVTKGLTGDEDQLFELSTITQIYINQRVLAEDKAMVEKALSQEVLLERMRSNEDSVLSYRVAMDGAIHYYQAKLVNTDYDGWCVIAFQNIDEQASQERVRADEMEKAMRAAESANRAKSNFLSNVSHDIRTPMNAINGYTDIAAAHLDDQDLLAHAIQNISYANDSLKELIDNILDMSRIESGKESLHLSAVDLQELLNSTVSLIRYEVDTKSIVLDTDSSTLVNPVVVADKEKIRRILVNLASNAAKYTDDGGEIWISLKEESCSQPGYSTYVFAVEDTGCGISDDFRSRMFTPFEREFQEEGLDKKGSGLGLSITKSYIDMMGGTIDVESEMGTGSKFTITLDLEIIGNQISDGTEGAKVPSSHVDDRCLEKPDFTGKRVLLVEDNKLNREIAKIQLEELGLEVSCAEDGLEALQALEASEDWYFDYVLMDMRMPVMDGITATKKIRSFARCYLRDIPIIALTANAFASDANDCIKAGMDAHIPKPFDISDLALTLDSLRSN